MGNAILCRSAPCTQPRPVYKTVLQQIFQIACEKPKADSASTKAPGIENETTAKSSPEDIDIPKLQAHVKSHIKGLIDYLEGSHNKLIDTGNYLYKVVTGSFNPDIHMLGVLVILELLEASSKFSHDKNFLAKLHQRSNNEDFIKQDGNTKGEHKNTKRGSKDLDSSSFLEYGQSLRGNVLQFEDNVVEILSFLIDGKKNPWRKATYKYVLRALELYAKNHIGTVTPEKMEAIMSDAMEMIENYQNFDDKESLEVQCQFMELLITLTKTGNISFKFKQKFINYSCSTLKICYEKNRNVISMSNDYEIRELRENITKLAFEEISDLTRSVFDLTEFGTLITPLFAFLDNTEWKNEQLQTDIFSSLMDSMSHKSFEQVEIFFIDKIVEYVDSDAATNHYKHNNDIGVKIRVFSSLATIFERAKKTFLSFLVIDNITLSFLNNLKINNTTEEGKQLKESIYNCQKQFIEKINRSSKNLSQLISSISAQIFAAAFKDNKDNQFVTAGLDFFNFTLKEIVGFPGAYFIQKECMTSLLKIRGLSEHSAKSFEAIERLLSIRCLDEEGISPRLKYMEGKKSELLNCPPDLVYLILSNNLGLIRDHLDNSEQSSEHSRTNQEFLSLILHFAKINSSLILRKDTIVLMILISFMKKIKELTTKENIKTLHKELLLYLISSFFKHLQAEWNIDPLTSPRQAPVESPQFNALFTAEKNQNLTSEESHEIVIALGSMDQKVIDKYYEDFDKRLEVTTSHLKTIVPISNFENLNDDFDDLGSHYGGNQFLSVVDDGDSHRIEQSMEHNNRSNLDNTPKPHGYNPSQFPSKRTGRKDGSLISIGQINQNSVMKNSVALKQEGGQQEESESSDFVDKSFENALKEAKKNKVKPTNLNKILNNQI